MRGQCASRRPPPRTRPQRRRRGESPRRFAIPARSASGSRSRSPAFAPVLGRPLTLLFQAAQELAWGVSDPAALFEAARQATPLRHVALLLAAGLVTGLGQWLLRRLTAGNGIEITAAIWFEAGRLPALRTLCSAVLSIVIVGMGAPLGREGAPKQFGGVFGNLASDLQKLSDEQRRLMVAIGAGAGMAAVYSVPLGGALFALEVLRGALALRLVMPALAARSSPSRRRASSSRTRPSTKSRSTPFRPMSISGRSQPRRSSACGRSSLSGRSRGPIASVRPAGGVWLRRLRRSSLSESCRSSFPSCSATARMLRKLAVPASARAAHPRRSRSATAACDRRLRRQRRAWGPVHAFARRRRADRFRAGMALALGPSGRRNRPLRAHRRGRDAGRDNARAGLVAGADDGIDRPGPRLRPADADRDHRRHRDIAPDRAAIDLRGPAHRRAGGGAAQGARGGRLVTCRAPG